MKTIKTFFHFLGSVIFACLLIAVALLFVGVGTVIESRTGSHHLAASFTYHHPLFQMLLGLFFLNILFAALRRWPFKVSHLPFLMTHLGLLMIIAGVMLKHRYGLQAHVFLTAGASTSHGFVSDAPVLHMEKRVGNTLLSYEYPVFTSWTGAPYVQAKKERSEFLSLSPTITAFAQKMEETWEGWIKEDRLEIAGLPSIPVTSWAPSSLPLPIHYQGNLFPSFSEEIWNIQVFRCQDLAALVETAYLQHQRQNIPHPTLCVVQQNEKQEVHLFFFDTDGEIQHQFFSPEQLSSFVVYEGGFGGYAIQADYVPPLLREDFLNGKAAPLTLETPLIKTFRPIEEKQDLSVKPSPVIVVDFLDKKDHPHSLHLPFDPSGIGLKWPLALDGETYLIRFQPRSIHLPYRLKLHDARQISYPNSTQPFSFEATLRIQDRKKGKTAINSTLSMNQVYTTPEGYRFYLTNLTPAEETGLQKIQLTVNYDPAKAWMTYPGAVILALGIAGLFWGPRKVKNVFQNK